MAVTHIALLLYVSIFILYILSILSLEKLFSHRPKVKSDTVFKIYAGFQPYFFTLWTFTLHMIFVILAILDETSKILKLPVAIQKRLGKTRAFIFNTLLFPSCLLVSTFFWGIWHIDRELIFPKAVDEFFPSWLNHMLHTFTLVPMVIELLLPKKYNFVQFRQAAPILIIYSLVYGAILISLYLRHGVWIYPVFKIFTWPQRIFFLALIMAVQVLFLKIGISIQNTKRPSKTAKIK
ncbi:androgen-dependent TFPI-regulating protein isoform X1 [Leptinotarsa decemlineata]|uniref:androgen-dependent TFPI-regulating protein isoform X1 n=1 Tax=Leptinotarsa decemlineata TaxID=7539 RepID=UPI003D304577